MMSNYDENDELRAAVFPLRRCLFPAARFALANSINDQVAHILSEIDEAAAADGCADFDAAIAADPRALLQELAFFRELADVQASIETLWRVLDRVIGAGFSETMILAWVEQKNRERGYYLPAPRLNSFAQLAKDYGRVSYCAVLPGGPRGNDEEHF